MDKRQREFLRAVKPHGYKFNRWNGRCHMVLRNDETGHEVVCASSPRNLKHAIHATIRDIRLNGGSS
jgi:hypothetical protein